MKTTLKFYIVITLLTSCLNQSQQNDLTNKTQDSTLETASNTDQATISDPLIDSIKKITPSTFSDCNIEIESKTSVNNQTYFIIYSVSDGVCLTKYIMTFKDNKFKDYEELDKNPDQDFSITHYEFRQLKESNKTKFLIANYKQTVADKNVINNKDGYFKEGYNFENVKIKTDSTIISLTVLNDGNIKRDTIK